MQRTRDTEERTLVVVLDSKAMKDEECEVALYDVSWVVRFKVIVHRDVVIGEVLELDQ